MIPVVAMVLLLEAARPAAARRPGIYFQDTSLCGLEQPAPSTDFRNPARLPSAPSFLLVLSRGAEAFGIRPESLLLIERRLGGIILIEVPITATAVAGQDATYEVVPARELWPDDYAFAIKQDAAIVFFGCIFTTLPSGDP